VAASLAALASSKAVLIASLAASAYFLSEESLALLAAVRAALMVLLSVVASFFSIKAKVYSCLAASNLANAGYKALLASMI
jgi:hypothetical protein